MRPIGENIRLSLRLKQHIPLRSWHHRFADCISSLAEPEGLLSLHCCHSEIFPEWQLRVGFCRSLPVELNCSTVQLCCDALGGNRPRTVIRQKKKTPHSGGAGYACSNKLMGAESVSEVKSG